MVLLITLKKNQKNETVWLSAPSSCLNSNDVALNKNEVLCFTFGYYYGLKTTMTWNQMTFKSADGFPQKQADM